MAHVVVEEAPGRRYWGQFYVVVDTVIAPRPIHDDASLLSEKAKLVFRFLHNTEAGTTMIALPPASLLSHSPLRDRATAKVTDDDHSERSMIAPRPIHDDASRLSEKAKVIFPFLHNTTCVNRDF